MIALALILMAQTTPSTVTDAPGAFASIPARTAGIYLAVTDQLAWFFRGEQKKMLNSFSDDVELAIIDTVGVRRSQGKAAIWRTYSSLLPLNGGSENHSFSCEAAFDENICHIYIGRGQNQRRFVAAYKVKDSLIVQVVLRESAKEASLSASLRAGTANG